MATDDQTARPRDAEMALAQARSLPKPALARLPPTRQTARKGRLNFLYLKRVFGINVNVCVRCGGSVRIVASIEEPSAIRAILAHFEKHGALEEAHYRPAARAPPAAVG